MPDGRVLGTLVKILGDVVGAARIPPGVGADTELRDGGLWLDSVEVLQVVVACELEFGITFEPAQDLVGDGLETLGTLAAAIQRRNGSGSTAMPAQEPLS